MDILTKMVSVEFLLTLFIIFCFFCQMNSIRYTSVGKCIVVNQ